MDKHEKKPISFKDIDFTNTGKVIKKETKYISCDIKTGEITEILMN